MRTNKVKWQSFFLRNSIHHSADPTQTVLHETCFTRFFSFTCLTYTIGMCWKNVWWIEMCSSDSVEVKNFKEKKMYRGSSVKDRLCWIDVLNCIRKKGCQLNLFLIFTNDGMRFVPPVHSTTYATNTHHNEKSGAPTGYTNDIPYMVPLRTQRAFQQHHY